MHHAQRRSSERRLGRTRRSPARRFSPPGESRLGGAWIVAREAALGLALGSLLVAGAASVEAAGLRFTEVSRQSGIVHAHRVTAIENPNTLEEMNWHQYSNMSGGVAAGDYDGDGWIDLYVVGGDRGRNRLFRNAGGGSFEKVSAGAGVDLTGLTSGPIFADYDGDGRLDLFVGGLGGTASRLLRNAGGGRFEDVTRASGLRVDHNTFSAAFGDYDLDGDLDLALSHWQLDVEDVGAEHLWRNDGDGSFTDVSRETGVADAFAGRVDVYSFTPTFADIDNDGWPDLLMAGDFGTSLVLINLEGRGFQDRTDRNVLTDENGMGAAVADYDNDGDLDWFVSSVHFTGTVPKSKMYNFGRTGNRLYQNRGDGRFVDVTDRARVRDGAWGWAACFADFDNDGHMDLFHVNGMGNPTERWWREMFPWFLNDRSRLFIADGAGRFTETSRALGLDDAGQGRGIVCFDYDRDGDIDIFVANNGGAPRLYRNELRSTTTDGVGYLNVKLKDSGPNSEAVGARVYLRAGGAIQMRELRSGSNFASHNPVEAHFGLGGAGEAEWLCVVWPGRDRKVTMLSDVAADQHMVIRRSTAARGTSSSCPGPGA